MAELITIARPYAEAAFRLARDAATLGAWSDALALLEAVTQHPGVQAAMGDPNVTSQALEGLVLGTLGEQVDAAVRNFVQVLIANDRLLVLPQIREIFEAQRREHEGVLEVRVVSAFALDEAQLRDIVAALEAKYGRRVSAKVDVDQSLIGGVRLLIGDQVIDGTVRGKLDAMAVALTH